MNIIPLLFTAFAIWSIGKVGLFVICIILSWYIDKKISGFFSGAQEDVNGSWVVQQLLSFVGGTYDNNIDAVITTLDNTFLKENIVKKNKV